MRSSKWSRMPAAATCCSMARGPVMGPVLTGQTREPRPTRCPWSSALLLLPELRTSPKTTGGASMGARHLGGVLVPCSLCSPVFWLCCTGTLSDRSFYKTYIFPNQDSLQLTDFSLQKEKTLLVLMHLNAWELAFLFSGLTPLSQPESWAELFEVSALNSVQSGGWPGCLHNSNCTVRPQRVSG